MATRSAPIEAPPESAWAPAPGLPCAVNRPEVFNGSFELPESVRLNEPFTVEFVAHPTRDIVGARFRLNLPRAIGLVEGLANWSDDLHAGVPYQRAFKVMVLAPGSWRPQVIASDPSTPRFDRNYIFFVRADSTGAALSRAPSPVRPAGGAAPSPAEETAVRQQPTVEVSGRYAKLAPQEAQAYTVTGRFYYDDPHKPGLLPVRGATVRVYSVGWLGLETEIGSGYTSDVGSYSISVNCSGAVQMRLKVFNECSAAKGVPSCGLLGCDPYYARWPNEGTVDLTCASGYVVPAQYLESQYSNWQAVDYAVDAYRWIADRTGGWTRPQVIIHWPETGPGCTTTGCPTGIPCAGADDIYLPENTGCGTWESSDVYHEYAHAVMRSLYDGTNPGGCSTPANGHFYFSVTCEGFALTEGWAEFIQTAVSQMYGIEHRGCSNGVDYIESNYWWKGDATCSNTNGAIVEGSVASILWDIYDNPISDDDALELGLNGATGSIWAILRDSKPAGINAFWDAWRARYGYAQALWSIYASNGINKDVTPPTSAGAIVSNSHVPRAWSGIRNVATSWSAASDDLSGVAGYSSAWNTSPSSIPAPLVNVTGTTTTSASLADGASWHFHIRSGDNAGNWNAAAVDLGPFYIDGTAPAAPGEFASPSHTLGTWSDNRNVTSSWAAPNDAGGSGVAGYSWQWSTTGTTLPDAVADGTGTTTTSTALADGATWYLHVRSKDAANNWSSAAGRHGPFKIDGAPPTNPTVSSPTHTASTWSLNNSATMTWTGASDGSGSGVAGYSWQWSMNSSTLPDAVLDGTGAATTSDVLLDGTNWYFSLRTVDAIGQWAGTPARFGPLWIDATAPQNPTSVFSSSHQRNVPSADCTIDVSWSSASDATSGVAGYSWVWDNSPSTLPPVSLEGVATSATSPSLADGTWYIHVRARDRAGNWCATAVDEGPFVIAAELTAAPSGCLASSDRCDGVLVSWTWAGADHEGFKVYRNGLDSLVVTLADSAARSYLDTSVAAGNAYSYAVRAYNACGDGGSSPACLGQRPETPSIITQLVASSGLCARIDLAWSYEGPPPTGFRIERVGPGNGVFQTVFVGTDAAQRTWTDSPLGGGSYVYYVCPYIGSCIADVGINISGACLPPLSGFPGTVTASSDQAGHVDLTWHWHPTSEWGYADGFHIYRDGRLMSDAYKVTGEEYHGARWYAWVDSTAIPGRVYEYVVGGFVACGEPTVGASGSALSSPFAWPAERVPVSEGAGDVVAGVVPLAHPETGEVTAAYIRRSATDWDIYAQRFDASGQPLWGAGGVAVCTAAGDQHAPTIVADGAGGVYLAWWDQRSGSDIYAQRISSTGEVLWASGGVPVCAAAGMQFGPVLLPRFFGMWGNGVLVAWSDGRNVHRGTYGQLLDAWDGDGHYATDGQMLLGGLWDGDPIAIESDAGGGAYLLATRYEGPNADVAVQHVEPAVYGGLTFSAIEGSLVTGCVPGSQTPVGMIPADSGHVIVAWLDQARGGRIGIQRLRPDLGPVTGWPDSGVIVATGASGEARMCTDYRGGGFLVWMDPAQGIYVQHFDSTGRVPAGAPSGGTPICLAPLSRCNISIVPDGLGGAYVAWGDGRTGGYGDGEVYATRVTPEGALDPGWPENGLGAAIGPGMQYEPTLAHMSAAGAILGWKESGGARDGLYLAGISPGGTVSIPGASPSQFDISNAWPNPGRGPFRIRLALPEPRRVAAQVFDVQGRCVRTVIDPNTSFPPGIHELEWDGLADGGITLPSGVYLVRIQVGGGSKLMRVAVVR